jgi:hypothetical protein
MRTSLALLVTVSCLAGCTTSKPMQGPNGRQAFFIKCPAASIDSCYEEASKVCPKGYAFADKGGNAPGVIVPVGGVLVAGRGPNTMLVECKE